MDGGGNLTSTKDKVAFGLAAGAAIGTLITSILLLYFEFRTPAPPPAGHLSGNFACTIQLLLHVWMGMVTLAVTAFAVYIYPDEWIPYQIELSNQHSKKQVKK